MRLTRSAVVFACALALLSAASFAESPCPPSGSLSFPITLSGTQFGGNGSSTGFGTGFLTLNPLNNTATVTLNTTGLGPNVTSAGLFTGGTSTVPFFSNQTQIGTTTGFDQNGNFTNTVTLTPQQMNAILTNPSAFTFGVSTGEFPNGAVSGTLLNSGTFGGTFSGTNIVGSTGVTSGGGTFSSMIVPNTSTGGSTLYYTFTPYGIGNTFTGLTLNQGGVGVTTTPFITLSNGGTLTGGRFTGSTTLTAAQTQALLSNPNNFNVVANTSSFPNGAIRAQFGVTQNEQWFPVAGKVTGALGNQWTTDITVFNMSSTAPATVTVEVFPANQTNVTAGGTMNAFAGATFTVSSRATNTISNAAQGLFTDFSGLGALRLTSDQPIVAIERIYDANANASGNIAASAQAIFGKTDCEAIARGLLAGVNSTGAVRANAGFFNPNPTTVTVQVNGNASNGSSLGAMQTLTLQPYQLIQVPAAGAPGISLFAAPAGVTDALLSYVASAPIFAYTSVTNNASGDTHVTFARPDLSSPSVAASDLAAIAIVANQGEIQEGQLASSRASATAVQQFAQLMVSDHTNALAQVQNAMTAAGITASTNNPTALYLQSQTQAEINTLNGLSGAAFDRAYMQMQVNDHQKALQLLDTIVIPSAAATPQVMSVLQQMRATVAQHLAMAQAILAQLP